MTAYWNGFHSPLASHIEQYLRAKRAIHLPIGWGFAALAARPLCLLRLGRNL